MPPEDLLLHSEIHVQHLAVCSQNMELLKYFTAFLSIRAQESCGSAFV